MTYNTFEELLKDFPELKELHKFYRPSELEVMKNGDSVFEHVPCNFHYFQTLRSDDNCKFLLLTSEGFISSDGAKRMSLLNFCNKYSETHKLIYVVSLSYCYELRDGLIDGEFFDIIVHQ